MPLTAAEKQRRYRQKLKDKDEEGEKEKERKRWATRQLVGKVKNIASLTPIEQCLKREKWKIYNKRRRQEKLQKKALPILSSNYIAGPLPEITDGDCQYISKFESSVKALPVLSSNYIAGPLPEITDGDCQYISKFESSVDTKAFFSKPFGCGIYDVLLEIEKEFIEFHQFALPLTAAERQRRYRQKLKDKDAEGEKEKERKRWAARQLAGKVKNIADLTPTQQRLKRVKWKNDNKRRRQEKLQKKALSVLSSNNIAGRLHKIRDGDCLYISRFKSPVNAKAFFSKRFGCGICDELFEVEKEFLEHCSGHRFSLPDDLVYDLC